MKTYIIAILALCVFCACSEDDYLVDGGISDPHVNMTTLDFLKSHSQLDTLALLITRAELEDEVNGNATLFAPTNYSIQRYVNARLAELRQADPQAEYTVNDIPVDTLKKYMGAYIINEKVTRADMKEEGKIYTTLNGEERMISLEPETEYSGQLSDKPEYVYYTIRYGSDWEDPNTTTKLLVSTSNLISTNGVIHVLKSNHILFDYDD